MEKIIQGLDNLYIGALYYNGSIYAATSSGIYISDNLGDSWSLFDDGHKDVRFFSDGIADEGAAIYMGGFHGLLKGEIKKGDWSDLNLHYSSTESMSRAGKNLYLLADGRIYLSKDGLVFSPYDYVMIPGIKINTIYTMNYGENLSLYLGTNMGIFRIIK